MIYRIYPLLNDFENLSRLKVESSDYANTFDYANLVVNKPWGYEYLWFQNKYVAIWLLFIDKNQKTSLHCHAKKRTSLIVLDGTIKCTTLDDNYTMNHLEALVLEPCVFHSSQSVHELGTVIMEIETPPMKGDLVRMTDAYGRQKSGYEKNNEYSTDFDKYEFKPFTKEVHQGWNFREVHIYLSDSIPSFSENTRMIVPISGNIKSEGKVVFEVGESIPFTEDIAAMTIDGSDNQFLVFKSR